MIKEIQLLVHPDYFNDYSVIKKIAAGKLKINPEEINAVKIIKRSIDARRKVPHYSLKIAVFIGDLPLEAVYPLNYQYVQNSREVIIVGSGPAGLFAALRLLENGVKPIIFERGKDVQSRRRDIARQLKSGIVNEDSNYCFGEGGAGTFSDGKLYTRSKKRGDVKKILEIFVKFGAPENILIDSHPHLGSNKLPKIVKAIGQLIIERGGEIHFESKVTDLIINRHKVQGVIVNDSYEVLADSVILATGHSAREIYYLFNKKNWGIKFKNFAVGVRVEHPQSIIDFIQYHSGTRHQNLPAASYSLSCQVNNRGVYSFCMCPGGMIIPASTNSKELVLNGMSVSKRNSPFANAGIVTSISGEDLRSYEKHGELKGVEFQKELEVLAFKLGGGNQAAPAQKIKDFIENRISNSLLPTSYLPGIFSAPLHEVLPLFLTERLKKGAEIFNKKMKMKFWEQGQMLFPETRTSAPVRILRDKNTFQQIKIEGLFPAGEGSGYAGGIVSSALDGEKAAEAAMSFMGVL